MGVKRRRRESSGFTLYELVLEIHVWACQDFGGVPRINTDEVEFFLRLPSKMGACGLFSLQRDWQ